MKNVYFIPVSGDAREFAPENGKCFNLQELYKKIDCNLIEVVYLPNGLIMIVDEEGRLNQKPINRLATTLVGGIIVGDVVVCPSKMLR